MSTYSPLQATIQDSLFKVCLETQLSCFGPQKASAFEEEMFSLKGALVSTDGAPVSTQGVLGRTVTYDNHPIP